MGVELFIVYEILYWTPGIRSTVTIIHQYIRIIMAVPITKYTLWLVSVSLVQHSPPVECTVVQHARFAAEGDVVTMACHTGPGATTWQRDGQIIAQDSVDTRGVTPTLSQASELTPSTLTISQLSTDTEGEYSCHSEGQTDTLVFQVSIAVEPPWVELAFPDGTVTQGDFVELTCTAGPSNPVPDIVWTQLLSDGSTLTYTPLVQDSDHGNGTVTRSSSVTVLVSRSMYGSQFYCTVTAEPLHYIRTAKAKLDINVTPSGVALLGFDVGYIAGDTAVLSCVLKDARPPGVITWYMDGNPVNAQPISTRNPNGTYDVTSKLDISLSSAYDGTQFICVGTSPVMDQLGQAELRANAQLSVKYSPEIILDDTPVIVWQRKTLFLVCQFSANPSPSSIVWFHNGARVSPGAHLTVTNDNTSSSLHSVSAVSSDKGQYHCEVENEVGTSKSNPVSVTVLHAPECAGDQKLKYGVPIGGTVVVTCQMEANPNTFVFFQWQINGTMFTMGSDEGDGRPEHVSSRYNYSVRTMDDYQPLECRATNGVHSPGQPCQIYILPPGPALPPVDCRVAEMTSAGGLVTCREDYDGGSSASYTLQLVGESGPRALVRHNAPVFSVSGLAPQTEHALRVCASNTDYPETSQCTETFILVTIEGPDSSEEPLVTSQVNSLALALGISLGFIVLFGIAGMIMVIVKKRQDSRAQKEYGGSPFPQPVSTGTPNTDRVRVPAQQNPAYCHESDDFHA